MVWTATPAQGESRRPHTSRRPAAAAPPLDSTAAATRENDRISILQAPHCHYMRQLSIILYQSIQPNLIELCGAENSGIMMKEFLRDATAENERVIGIHRHANACIMKSPDRMRFDTFHVAEHHVRCRA
jgi:hypothetical protein